ncbi:hypothetical protein, conserved [Leishmania tarentolae]|uniref:RING-type domain-containing protein n=1 Tax=Leishmania tarentolae TaxID=5689 RepID=A0A640KG15_LEITA|nr:hypothetical protein, conserved [Leishmania tarentolae]
MAGLHSENISMNSTRLPEQSTSDKDICVFCFRRATPSVSDPHAPLFPFFSLVDCRHYACQPCALVHCDNAGRRIFCPKCHCVSRLAQSGRRRTRSSAAATDADADRVSIDDGVSSTRSRRSRTGTTPHRSALKGKNGTSKRRASSVQFPANPTASIVPGDSVTEASGAAAVPSESDSAGEQHHQRRASSPLTQEAVDALPLDPAEARRRRAREQQLRAAEAAAKSEKAVGLYTITAPPLTKVAPPPPSASAASGTTTNEGFKRAKDRSRSQPVPKLPHTILEPKEEYPPPPPLLLHTVDEEDQHVTAAPGDRDLDAKSVLPSAAADAAAATIAEEDVKTDKRALGSVSVSKTSMASSQMEAEVEAATAFSEDKSQGAGVLSPPTEPSEELERPHQLLDDCESTEAEERGVIGDVEEHERAVLMQRMEEEDTAIRARRGLVVEFDSTPILLQKQKPAAESQHSHHDHAGSSSLIDFSDQVSATSEDELSQRVSGYKSATRSSSASRRRRHTSSNGASDLRTQPHDHVAGELDEKMERGVQVTTASTPSDALSSAAKSVAGAGSAENVRSTTTAAGQGRVSIDEEGDDSDKLIATIAAVAEANAKQEAAAARAAVEATAAAEAQSHAEALRAAEDARALAEGQERARQLQLQREAEEEAAEKIWQQQRHEEEMARERQQHEERAAFASQALQDRECLAREALEQAEAAVREHYERSADEWLTAALPHELEAQRLVRATAEHRRQQEKQQSQLVAEEGLDRDELEESQSNAWSWLLAGAHVDRVVAATEEGNRVQREYEELRVERLQSRLRENTRELVYEEAHSRASFIEYEAATRSLLQNHHTVQRQALAEEEQREKAEFFKKAAVRREAALHQRFQWELDELEAEEVGCRAMLREEEREERRTANLVFLQTLASTRRKEVLAQHAAAVAAAGAADDPGGSSVLSEAPTMIAGHMHRGVQQRQTDVVVPLAIEEDADGGEDAADMATSATPPQLLTPLITTKELAELRAREASYAAELQTALERLREAERRVAEEAAIRTQAEQERQAAHTESRRLLWEAEQRAEERIREARHAAEQLLQAQLAHLRDEADRRAEHAAVMQALAEEEKRAVLEAKLQAAQRQLDEAQQRAQEEVRRARADAAEMAAADAARAAREAQRRDEEWQERCRAEHLLRLAEQEREKEDAVRRLAEIEARAAEAVRLAQEEAARTAAEAQERLAEMERRQQAREAEVQSAAQRVRNAQESLRGFDSSTESSRYATPFRVMEQKQRPPTNSSNHQESSLAAASSIHATRTAGVVASQASVHTPLQTPPLVPPSARTSSVMRRQMSVKSPMSRVAASVPEAGTAASSTPSDAAPPKVMISSQQTPLSSDVAPGLGRSRAAVPSSSASAAGTTSLATIDPADIIRAAICSAVQEIVEAQRRTQARQDRAERNVELSERRYHRHESDRLRAARDVVAIESSYAASEVAESEERHQKRRAWSQQIRPRQSVRGHERDSRTANSRLSEEPLQSVRSSRGDYAQEVSEGLWTRGSSSPASGLSPTGAPLSTASPAAAARSVSSDTLLNASSVYFDNSYPPSATALGATHQLYGRGARSYAAVRQPQGRQGLSSFAPYSSASRVLFAPRMMHTAREAWAADDGEYDDQQNTSVGVGAHTYSRVASQQQQPHVTGAAQIPLRQPLPRAVGSTAAGSSAAHAYYEPEPLPPAPVTMEYSPPSRRSATRTAAEVEPQQQRRSTGASAKVDSGGGIGALPEPSRMCPRCYRTDTTSPCWRCGEMICRHCGLPPGSARKLCCTAHHRSQLREFTRRKTYENGTAATAAGASKVPPPRPRQQPKQQPRLRGEQQVQTSFASSAVSAQSYNDAPFADEPAARLDVGTSPLTSLSAPFVISPSAYRVPEQQQQQQQQPQAQLCYPNVYQAFTTAGSAASSQQPMYSPSYHSAAAAYPYANPHTTLQPHQLPSHQLPLYADSERPHIMLPRQDSYVPPLCQQQPYAPFGYSVRAATAALGIPATGPDGSHFSAPTAVSEVRQHQETAAMATGAWVAHERLPPPSGPAAVGAASMPHAAPAGLARSPPPTSVMLPSQQEANEVTVPRDTEGGAMAETAVPEAPVMDGTPDAQVQRQPPRSTRVDDNRTDVEAKQPVATESRILPNATVAAVVSGSATTDASLPGNGSEMQEGTTTPVDAVPSPDGDAAAENSGNDVSAAVLEEPKTERKKTFPAFFVSLGDGSDAAEPRRPKPPTPRNFVPSQLLPPPPPPPKKPQRRNFSSGMLLTSKTRSGGRTAHHQPPSRKLSPLQAHEMNCARKIQKSISPCRGLGAQRHQRPTSPSPYEQAPKASGASNGPRETLLRSRSKQPHRRHADANDAAASMPESIKSYIKSLSPMVVVDESGTPVVYEAIHKVKSSDPWMQQQQQGWSATAAPAVHDIYLSSGGIKGAVAEAAQNSPESSHGHSKPCRFYTDAASQQHQRQRSSHSDSYYPYFTSSGATSETQPPPPPQTLQQHLYAPPRSHTPAHIPQALPIVDRRVPTLAELEKRLQQLRIIDEHEAAQYHRRQAQHVHDQQPQRIHVLLRSPGAVAVGGDTRRLMAAPPCATRDLALSQPRRHNSATGRHPQQRTVSPPWRTDLNSSPVRRRWDISQPHSSIYHPAPATLAGN